MKDPRIAWLVAGTFAVLAVVFAILLLTRDGDSAATTTTALPSPATTTTTTTSVPDTSSTSTTTTVVETTTTTVAETTTTIAEGPWAARPLVVASFGALGWWDGTTWVQALEDTELPVSGGEDYRVAPLDGDSPVTPGGAPTVLCDPLANPGVELEDSDLLGEWPGPITVAISAPWELQPHLVEVTADDGTYAVIASEVLAARGVDVADPDIVQLVRLDLEGDGVEEALVVTERIGDPGLLAEPGDFSMVFLRKVVEGEVLTAILAESIVEEVGEGETPFVLSFRVGAVADLNGDERMEVVVSSAYYEGAGVEVWEWVDDDLGPVFRIGSGCGA